MKTSIKFATGLILVAAALVASGSAAQAGEGGAAGSVSIKFTNATDVTRLSTSVAVGKNYGVAIARTNAATGATATSAAGAGGGFTLTGANSAAPEYTATAESATGILLNQVNTFAGSGATTLKPTTGVTLAD
jgi:hypothetical protein